MGRIAKAQSAIWRTAVIGPCGARNSLRSSALRLFDAGIPQDFLESPLAFQGLWYANRLAVRAQPDLMSSAAGVAKIFAAMIDKEPSQLPVRH
jgi:hypothetical protein